MYGLKRKKKKSALINRALLHEISTSACVMCVFTDRSFTRGPILIFPGSVFSYSSCLRYVCATANSSLELNIQLVPFVSRDPRNELCG